MCSGDFPCYFLFGCKGNITSIVQLLSRFRCSSPPPPLKRPQTTQDRSNLVVCGGSGVCGATPGCSLSAARVRACWLARRRCQRVQAHNTVTPCISQRIALQGSYRVPYAQTNTSLSSWPTRIGVRVVLVHVGAHEMHEPRRMHERDLATDTWDVRVTKYEPLNSLCRLSLIHISEPTRPY